MTAPYGRRRAIALGLSVLVVTGVFLGLGTVRSASARPMNADGSTAVAVTASNGYAFTPNAIEQVATNSTVTVTFTDGSPLSHTFTIIGREGWMIPSSYSQSELDELAWGSSPAHLVNVNVSGSGDREAATFTSPGPGWYEFFCAEGGHFAEGMYGFIAFGMNLPSNLSVSSPATGPGAALFIILGSIVSLVVIALVLGFVVGRREGSKHEMPPERLGYPEPPSPEPPLPASQGPR
jgi:plastocyanin